MWDCCCESVKKIEKSAGSGCILAHCMGLGKTLQVSCASFKQMFVQVKRKWGHVSVVLCVLLSHIRLFVSSFVYIYLAVLQVV